MNMNCWVSEQVNDVWLTSGNKPGKLLRSTWIPLVPNLGKIVPDLR